MKCLKFMFCLFIVVYAKDYYELLRVPRDADNRDIRRAFKKLALTMHPDKNVNDKDAHEKFIEINKAYEVLKDDVMRKKYDLHGEEGLKEDFGKSWGGNYRSWNYYYESFGIYDDDPEIITLSRSDFEQSVLGSPDIWFINYYSPQCSHCHDLAPAWRSMAQELEGVIRIGAVNCEEDWMLCRQQNIHSYPSLIMYPQKEYYRGRRDSDDLIEFVLSEIPDKVIKLTKQNLQGMILREEYKSYPWLITVCKDGEDCLHDDTLKKLSIILDRLVNVGLVTLHSDKEICSNLDCNALVSYYQNLSQPDSRAKTHLIDSMETKSIVNEVLKLLPGPKVLSGEKFIDIRDDLESMTAQPWVVEFAKSVDESDSTQSTELKRLRALLPDVQIGRIDCKEYYGICSSWSLSKFPVFVVLKPGGSYEFHHGRFTAHDIATFVRESLSCQVKALSPKDFPAVTKAKEPWFIDFFAPWCPPCMQLLPEWRKASRSVGHLAKFGTVDCTLHSQLCDKHNIRSYPTTILYNDTVPHQFHGQHVTKHLEEFVKDILKPPVISLTSQTFEALVAKKSKGDIWVIDFFAPWCGPCQQLAPEWRKVAKMMKHNPIVHVGQIDCTVNGNLCTQNGVTSYPTIRLYPTGSKGTSRFHFYNQWHRDASSLQAWIYNYLPSKVESLGTTDFNDILQDPEPWLIDFYAPWCGHCQVFAPEFERIAQVLDGKVKMGKINCEELPHLCRKASVRAYPTVKLYSGSEHDMNQNPGGMDLHTLHYDEILSFIENELGIYSKRTSHDEL